MLKAFRLVLSLLFVLQFSLVADAGHRNRRDRNRNYPPRQNVEAPSASANAGPLATDDSDLIRAVRDRRSVFFVQASNVVVVKVLPDDTQGLKHQRWYVRLSDGSQVFAVYNIDQTARVPVQVGQTMSLGGEFKWTDQGALIHWLHSDPSGRRPNGYVIVNGQKYGAMH